MTRVFRCRVALVSALSAAVLAAAPLVGTQNAYAEQYPPSPSAQFYPPHDHPGGAQHPGGRPHHGHHGGHLAGTGMGMRTGLVMGGAATLIVAGIGALAVARRRRDF